MHIEKGRHVKDQGVITVGRVNENKKKKNFLGISLTAEPYALA